MSENEMYKNPEIKKEGSRIKIKLQIPSELLDKYFDSALKKRSENFVMPGFRKGEVPKEMVLKQLGEESIKEEAISDLASEVLSKLVFDKKLAFVKMVDMELEEGEEFLTLNAELLALPEIKLGDYKKIAQKHNSEELPEQTVSDEELESLIEELRREKAYLLTLEAAKKDKNIKMPDFSAIPKEKLPELDENDFKRIAGVASEEEFKEKLKAVMKSEKEKMAKDERLAKIIDEIIESSQIDLDDELVEMEVERIRAQLDADLKMMNLSFEEYLKRQGESEESLYEKWREFAEKRVKSQLVMDEIAKLENIKADPEELKKQLEFMQKQVPDLNKAEALAYLEAQKVNEEVLNFLENLK